MGQRVDFIETDVRLTTDERFVLIHSNDHIEETTNGQGSVAKNTLADIRSLDAGSHFAPTFAGTPVPALDELLSLARGKLSLLLDTSGDDHYYRLLIKCLVDHDVLDHVLIGVRASEAVNLLRRLAPSVKLLSLGYPEKEALTIAEHGTDAVRFWGCWPELIAAAPDTARPVWVMAGAPTEEAGGRATYEDVVRWRSSEVSAVILDDPGVALGRPAHVRSASRQNSS